MSGEPTDAEIDRALARMAHLLGPEFVAECEAGIIKETEMTDKPIDFESEKERRSEAAIDADQARWEFVHHQLLDVMATSELSHVGLTSATLRALLDMLLACGMELEAAKRNVALCLNAFFEEKT